MVAVMSRTPRTSSSPQMPSGDEPLEVLAAWSEPLHVPAPKVADAIAGRISTAEYLRVAEDAAEAAWLRDARRVARLGVRPAPLTQATVGSAAGPLDAFGHRGPQLVLAATLDAVEAHLLPEPRHWIFLDHRHAGVSCHHLEVVATVLPVTDRAVLAEFDRFAHGPHGAGCVVGRLDDLAAYHGLLNRLGLSANWSFDGFAEALYPLDLTRENLNRLGVEDLDLAFYDVVDRVAGSFRTLQRWRLLVLTENCD
jgi:hypothetical protein